MVRCFSVLAVVIVSGWERHLMAHEPAAPGRQVAQRVILAVPEEGSNSVRRVAVDFWLYLPKGDDSMGGRPLVLFLHGAGERGNDLDRVKIHGPPKLIAAGTHFPFILVAPQQPQTQEDWHHDRWSPATLMALVDDVAKNQKADPSRLYVTGLSMGGYGTWDLVTAFPNRFAAAVPICGGGEVKQAPQIASLPIWAFHGDADETVPLEESQKMVEAVIQAGGHAKLTIYRGVGHDSWTQTYENRLLYNWLLSHRRPPD